MADDVDGNAGGSVVTIVEGVEVRDGDDGGTVKATSVDSGDVCEDVQLEDDGGVEATK
jgi:hypothetical protein